MMELDRMRCLRNDFTPSGTFHAQRFEERHHEGLELNAFAGHEAGIKLRLNSSMELGDAWGIGFIGLSAEVVCVPAKAI